MRNVVLFTLNICSKIWGHIGPTSNRHHEWTHILHAWINSPDILLSRLSKFTDEHLVTVCPLVDQIIYELLVCGRVAHCSYTLVWRVLHLDSYLTNGFQSPWSFWLQCSLCWTYHTDSGTTRPEDNEETSQLFPSYCLLPKNKGKYWVS